MRLLSDWTRTGGGIQISLVKDFDDTLFLLHRAGVHLEITSNEELARHRFRTESDQQIVGS